MIKKVVFAGLFFVLLAVNAAAANTFTAAADDAAPAMCDIYKSCDEEAHPYNEANTSNTGKGDKNPKGIYITFFYSPTCEHCHKVDLLLGELVKKYPQIYIHRYNAVLKENAELKEAFDIMYDVPQERRAYVPAVYLGDRYFIGEEEAGGIEETVIKYIESGSPCYCKDIASAAGQSRGSIIDRFKSFSVLAVLLAGLVDSVNPCAFAGIIFLISYLAISGRKGRSILIIGGLYSAGVFAAYMSLGLGFTSFIAYAEEATIISKMIYPLTALVALGFAVYSFLDYRKARQGRFKEMTLQLPENVKKITHMLVRKFSKFRYLMASSFLLGFVISLFEFLCTGQVYLPTIIYIMGEPELRAQASFYLGVYNLIFITPLVIIFVSAYLGTTSQKMSGIFMKNVAGIKLATAVFFVLLAAYLIYASAKLFALA